MIFDLYRHYTLQELRTMRTNAVAQGYARSSSTVLELDEAISERMENPTQKPRPYDWDQSGE